MIFNEKLVAGEGLSAFCFDLVLRDSGCTLPWKVKGEVFRRWILLEPFWKATKTRLEFSNERPSEVLKTEKKWMGTGKYSVKWFKSFPIGSMGPVCLNTYYIILSDQSNIGKYTNPMDGPWVFNIFQQIPVNLTTQISFNLTGVQPKNTGLKTMKVNLLVPTNTILMMNILWSRGTAGPNKHQGFFWDLLEVTSLSCQCFFGTSYFDLWCTSRRVLLLPVKFWVFSVDHMTTPSVLYPGYLKMVPWKWTWNPSTQRFGKQFIDLYYA